MGGAMKRLPIIFVSHGSPIFGVTPIFVADLRRFEKSPGENAGASQRRVV